MDIIENCCIHMSSPTNDLVVRCNETIQLRHINQPRLAVKKGSCTNNVIEATVIKGKYKGGDV